MIWITVDGDRIALTAEEAEARGLNQRPIPEAITILQAKAVMLEHGLLDDVEAIMASDLPTPRAKLDWAHAHELRRDHAMVPAIGFLLNLSSEQIDDLFIKGAQIGPLVSI